MYKCVAHVLQKSVRNSYRNENGVFEDSPENTSSLTRLPRIKCTLEKYRRDPSPVTRRRNLNFRSSLLETKRRWKRTTDLNNKLPPQNPKRPKKLVRENQVYELQVVNVRYDRNRWKSVRMLSTIKVDKIA